MRNRFVAFPPFGIRGKDVAPATAYIIGRIGRRHRTPHATFIHDGVDG
jgi:hypothetical protein